MTIKRRPTAIALVVLAPLVLLADAVVRAQQKATPSAELTHPAEKDLPPWNEPPTTRQIQALVALVIKNQHRDDQVLEQYARKERIVSHCSKGAAPSEWVAEVVPAGFHLVRVELERDGKAADPAAVEQQWQQAIETLSKETKTEDSDVKQNDDAVSRREHLRYEMVEAVGRAFHFQWLGRMNQGGRAVLVFSFEPDPAYKSSALFAIVYAHLVGTVWVDEASSQVVRIAVKLRDDLSIGKGLIVKIDRGAEATLQQEEIASGIWEPIHSSFDYEGHKFLFGTLSGHEQMDISDYRRLGSPGEALATIRREYSDPVARSR